MTVTQLQNTVKDILLFDFFVSEEDYKENALLIDLYPDFILLSNIMLFEKLIEQKTGQSIQLRGKISIINATVTDVIQLST